MALFGFSRNNATMQKFTGENFPDCPLCGTAEPYWTFKPKADLTDGRMQFCCDKCGSVFSITTADLSGLSKHSGVALGLYAGPAVALNTVTKTLKGKKVKTTYIKVEFVGNVEESPLKKGQELPIEELQRMMRK